MQTFTATIEQDGLPVATNVHVRLEIDDSGSRKSWYGVISGLPALPLIMPGEYRLIADDGRECDIIIQHREFGPALDSDSTQFQVSGPFDHPATQL